MRQRFVVMETESICLLGIKIDRQFHQTFYKNMEGKWFLLSFKGNKKEKKLILNINTHQHNASSQILIFLHVNQFWETLYCNFPPGVILDFVKIFLLFIAKFGTDRNPSDSVSMHALTITQEIILIQTDDWSQNFLWFLYKQQILLDLSAKKIALINELFVECNQNYSMLCNFLV